MRSVGVHHWPVIDRLLASAYRIPTAEPESDGTFEWDSTTLVLVELSAGDAIGIGYTYADVATASVIQEHLAGAILGRDPMAVPAAWEAMRHAVRNVGRPGIASAAIAAADNAFWDLKAHLLGVPLVTLLGAVRDSVPVYGSGGFTSYSLDQLREQLGAWVKDGIRRVKMKVGREPTADVERVRVAREAIGGTAELYVDANGAYSRKQALAFAERFAGHGVSWFEEPVSSNDLDGMRLIRDRAPPGMDIAAGEYGYDLVYFRRMLEGGAVDVLQADATRCAGMTEFLRVGALCAAHGIPLSAHTAPALHVHVCCALPNVRHIEYFADHVRIEQMLFDGARVPIDGSLRPDLSRPGLGLELKRGDAARYAV